MLTTFKKHIETQLHFLQEAKLLVACSGGLDSMVLTHLCQSLNLNYSLAHCNYNLRADESDGDQKFVEEYALKNDCQAYLTSFNMDDYRNNTNSSIQLLARDLRYEWFNKLMQERNFDYVLTAHHADDSLETFLINLSRGTGIKGLTGIPEQNGNIVRPLLPFSREEILAFANSRQLKWREDSSNIETKYLRNKVRHKIVPLLKELQPNFLENFKLTQQNLFGTSKLVDVYATEIQDALFTDKNGVKNINIEELKKKKPLKDHLHLLFDPYGFGQWDDIEQLLDATSGKKIYSKTHQLTKNRDFLLLSEFRETDQKEYFFFEVDDLINEPISMKITQVDSISKNDSNVLYVDSEKLKYPLLLRKWNTGDYFYPLGMKGKKKLSKFFKDEKIDVLSKKNIWLLCSSEKIVWVVGKRADERFKVTENTNKILKFELH
ncbi:tRNA lysidine(34) synthetase TilS [Croceitalea rosinachiae]|uniref:tRNA(Ile)-lysidine synthase n=1 Tax=Croceitalea rosinachiae TaxID=3075596 RepID=A0ABU3AC53_9FLAO|nr:tRNA lysidine(34) synthetase TilS [Croceitalea sp. F388]MDT0607751.1 tRNA lysidine(34) synthetase TilS [Croceitalea sp. F388]